MISSLSHLPLNLHDISRHMSFFLTVYIVSVIICQYIPMLGLTGDGKHPKKSLRAASRFMGIAHSLYCVPICTRLLFSSYPWDYSSPNTASQIALIHITLSYFLVDLIHFLLFEISDILLLVHHTISISFYLSILGVGYGGSSFLVAYFVGEITNPLQSTWFLTKEAGCLSAYGLLSPIFTACFLVVRVILTPPWVYAIIRDYFTGVWASHIPLPFAIMWSAQSIFMIIGSYIWAYKLVKGLRKFYAKKRTPTSTHTDKRIDAEEQNTPTIQPDMLLKKGL